MCLPVLGGHWRNNIPHESHRIFQGHRLRFGVIGDQLGDGLAALGNDYPLLLRATSSKTPRQVALNFDTDNVSMALPG